MTVHDGKEPPIVVVGAGAAGLTAAIFAADGVAAAEWGSRRPIVLLESTRDGGRKILISGGGRCNVLPSAVTSNQYVTASSLATLRNMLRSWPLADQRGWFEKDLGIRLTLERETGKLFPVGNRARLVRDALVARARALGVGVRFGCRVSDIEPAIDVDNERSVLWRLTVATPEGTQTLLVARLVLATGGLSVPNTGSDGAGLRWARALGHVVHPTYPALTPLTAEPSPHATLAGVSLEVTIRAPLGGKRKFETCGGFLFTHRGWSGPSVLNVSHHAVRSRLERTAHQPLLVQWTPLGEAEWDVALTDGGTGTVANQLRRRLPDRLADMLLEEAGLDANLTLSQLRREDRRRIIELLARYPLPWSGDEGYKKAEVTGGGVALGEVDSRTMESRRHPGLFLCGEMLDAFGPIGGYNFLWAWATGRAAGLGASRSL